MSGRMKETRFLLLLSVCYITLRSCQGACEQSFQCPEGWVRREAQCFKAYSLQIGWKDASGVCERHGARLVTVKDRETADFIAGVVRNASVNTSYWIGLKSEDNLVEGEWRNGQEMSLQYGFWYGDEPNTAEEKLCTSALQNEDNTWKMEKCTEVKLPFVCMSVACINDFLHCFNDQCVLSSLRCNGVDDCGDMTDEMMCSDLNSEYMYSESGGNIKYPASGSYSNKESKTWTLKAPSGKRIKLQFTEFITESQQDYLQICDGGPTESYCTVIDTVSGDKSSSFSYTSSTNYFLLKFFSDESVTRTGFTIQWTVVPSPEGATLTAVNQPQMITSPGFGTQYNGKLRTTWVITTPVLRQILTLHFHSIKLAARDDYLYIRDGNSPYSSKLLEYRGPVDEVDHIISSTGQSLYIYLHTETMNAEGGFNASYFQGCDVQLTTSQGMIMSPGYTIGSYPNSARCTWNISTPGNQPFALDFQESFELESGVDFLKIYNGTDTSSNALHIGSGFTGTVLPSTVHSSSGAMFIELTTSAVIAMKGFMARFSIDCPQELIQFNSWTNIQPSNALSTMYTANFNVSCMHGYDFENQEYNQQESVNMQCLYGGKWNILRKPVCKLHYCGSLGSQNNIPHGYLSNTTGVLYGDQAYYVCFAGFTLNGSNPVNCTEEGWVSNDFPRCEAPLCTPRPQVPNSNLEITGDLIAKYTCDIGYELVGTPTAVCNRDTKNWTAEAPVCQRKPCPAPYPVIRHASLNITNTTGVLYFEDTVMVTCDIGYELEVNVSNILTCNADQTFGELPRCIDINECNSTNNGNCSQNCVNTQGSYHCTCNPGYRTDPMDPFQCTDVLECSMNSGRGQCDDTCNEIIGSYNCSCSQTGTTLFSSNGTSSFYIPAVETGLMYNDEFYLNHTCVKVECGLPVNASMFAHLHARPLDVNLGRPFRYQDNITYLCDIGYVLVDGSNKMTLTCGQDGQWSGGLPECQAAMCMEEPVPSGAIAGTNNLTYQAVGEITCNVSGVRNETITRYCQYNQTSDSYMFTGQPIRCNVIDCGQPDTITGANITVVSTLYPSSFTVTCKDLYSLAGNSSEYDNIVRCTADGYWDYGDLRCEGATCSDPGRPPDGRQVAVDTYEEGKLVRYVCDRPGYEPDPPYPLLCEVAGSNLTWNASAPTCVDRESPVFTFCPGPFTVAKLSELFTMPFPNATDNSGMIRDIQVSPVDFHGYGMWIEQDMNVTYTAYDHANNTATCVVNIRLKDQEPPGISCPNSTTLVILEDNSQLVITQGGQLQGNYSTMFMAKATDNVTPRGEMTFIYSPPSQTLTSAMVDKRITFTATATDMAGNNASCSFDVVPRASPCSTWYLPTPKFGTKTCTTSNTTTSCTTICNSGYGFHGGQASIVYTCDTSADQPEWSNNGTVQDCVAPEIMAIYTVSVQDTSSSTPGLVYTTVDSTILSSCIQPYISELDGLIAIVAANLTNQCQVITGLSNIYIEVNQSTTVSNVVGRQLTVPLTLRILPSNLPKVSVLDCVATLDSHIRYLESGAMDRFMAARALGFVPAVDSCGQLNLPSGSRYEDVGGFVCPTNLVRNDQLCLPCPTGTYRDGTACTPCSPGQYQDEQAQTQCKNCPDGFTSLYAGSNRLDQCIEYCSEGMISDTGLAPCTMCPADTYFSNHTHCAPCPAGTTTNGVEGAKNSSGCKTECRPGYFSYNGRESCTACPLNFYQNSTGKTTCSRCSTDSVTTQVASDSIDNCTSQSSLCTRNDTCQNGGTCTVLGHVEQCLCPDGYTGQYCEDTINPCDSNPCFYNGTCMPLGGLQFRCDCYSAIVCTMVNETSNQTYSGGADEASTVPSLAACREKCVNSSQCSAITFSSSSGSCIIFYALSGRALTASSQAVVTFTKSCRNVSDFSGQFCESETNHCLSNDCQNGGMCQDLVGGFKCLCPSNSIYSGPKCTDSTPVCDQPANACQNGGTCRPIFGNIRSVCNCVAGFTGRNCETNIDDCEANPCLNGGGCTDGVNTRTCNCTHGYTGVNCETRLDMCAGITCAGKGTCVDDYTSGRVKCLCEPGYTSDFYWTEWLDNSPTSDGDDQTVQTLGSSVCEGKVPVEIECRLKNNKTVPYTSAGDVLQVDCTPQGGLLCLHGNQTNNQTCSDYQVRFRCTVPDDTCRQINLCNAEPCVRGACTPGENTFTCTCPPGYNGARCQHNIDECASDPCLNGGTCIDGINGYTCTCATGFTGSKCATNIDNCVNNTCDTMGTLRCVDMVDNYRCHCKPGYTDVNCSTDIDECASNPCFHQGTCAQGVNSFNCTCPPGWEGDRCERMTDICTNTTCGRVGTCINLFNDFFCNCTAPFYGRTCSESPDVCAIANPCINGGTCAVWNNSTRCDCPLGYYGDGCQLQRDYCLPNPCRHQGTCTVDGLNYTCACVPGYDGRNCEDKIDYCQTMPCPAGAECINDVTSRTCICPLDKTGPQCNKDIDRDFSLCFYSKKNGMASTAAPFPLGITTFSVGFWIRLFNVRDTGTFLTIYGSASNTTGANKTVFLQAHSSGINITDQYIPFDMSILNQLGVQDRNWHYLMLQVDNGRTTLYFDGFRNPTTVTAAGVPNYGWIIVGSTEGYVDGGTGGFQGCLSRLDVWSSLVSLSDLSKLYEFRTTFSVSVHLIARPVEFNLQGLVEKIWPSNITQEYPLPSGVQLAVSTCPADQQVVSRQRTVEGNWQEPTFQGHLPSTVISNYNRSSSFTWGKYEVVYSACDSKGDSVNCGFSYYVKFDDCTTPDAPRNGYQNCSSSADGQFKTCMVACDPGHAFLKPVPKMGYTCGPSGVWDRKNPQEKFIYPACGVLESSKVRINFILRVSLSGFVDCNNEGQKNTMIGNLRNRVITLANTWQGLCTASCGNVKIVITACNTSTAKRRKRATGEVATVEFTIENANETLYNVSSSDNATAVNVITQALLQDGLFDISEIASGTSTDTTGSSVVVQTTCNEGFQVVGTQCVQCTVGTLYNNNTAQCEDCPTGQYQSGNGQFSCTPCPPGQTTLAVGAVDNTYCVDQCEAGQQYNGSVCVPCPLGFYQPQVGKDYCLACQPGKTTQNVSSVNASQCFDSCPSGTELSTSGDGTCVVCDIGFFRLQDVQHNCVACPAGNITLNNGSTSVLDCNIPACGPGSFRDGYVCEACPMGTYQEVRWQTSCVNCSVSYSTRQNATSNSSLCEFYCPAGYEVKPTSTDCGTRTCTVSADCQACPRAYYKDATDKFGMCLPCNENFTTEANATVSENLCNVRNCSEGFYINGTDCIPCDIGSYQDQKWQPSCIPCPDTPEGVKTSTEQVQTTNKTQCKPFCLDGQQYNTNSRQCEDCPQGYYKNNTEGLFDQCRICSAEFVTPFVGANSSSMCTLGNCTVGQFSNASGVCVPCPLHTYQDTKWQTNCTSCGPGLKTLTTGSVELNACKRVCPPGQESVSGVCAPCPQGSYKNNDDINSTCVPCDNTTLTTSRNGSISNDNCTYTICPAGYVLNNMTNKCVECGYGFYQPVSPPIFEKCLPCPGQNQSTLVKNATQPSDCRVFCPDGLEDVGGFCRPCRRGSYKNNTGEMAMFQPCEACPVGMTTINQGSTSSGDCNIANCSAGYEHTADRQNCVQCPYGQYQAEVELVNATCKTCPQGQSTRNNGSFSNADCEVVCVSGQFVNSGQCEACPLGSYKTNGAHLDQFATDCTPCPDGNLTLTVGSGAVADCSIANCSAGLKLSTSRTYCEPCGYKKYRSVSYPITDPIANQTCQDCPSDKDTRTATATDSSQCEAFCPDGQEGNGTSCTACPRGYYKENSKTPLSKFLPCVLCPIDKITAGNGTTRETDCNIGNCTAGYYIHSSNNSCVPCPLNSYQPDKWQTSCILCPDNKTTATMATTALTECKYRCPLGQEDQSGTCRPCAIGSYKDTDGPESCTPCSNGRLTRNQGSTNESQCDQANCPPGTKNEANTCAVCSVGTYQDQSGQYACMSCPVYTNTVNSSSTSLQDCLSLCNDSLPTKYCEQGTCQLKTTGQPECICNPNYEGEFCHIHSDLRSELSFEAVVGLSVGFAALLTVLGIFGICYFCFKVRKTGKPSKALSTASRNGYFYNGYGPEDWNYYNGYYDGYGTPVGENGYDNRLGQTSEAMASYPYHRSAYQYYEDTDGQPVDLTAFEETLHSDFTTPKSYFSRYN
ncbi:uncharacterized protein LOC106170487 [Lingula anatina]|uniref:Uncharacterized protein LOC106170487 n=1 Tax=Lingula anatina TaxID=7574 RepID=A0A1S3J693_LINAN|nr:uncharacterized protein LOC106170487 [Lingula anatina]|eukprot:XP_013405828.1 uncharacterized protein LOC106170487 [Lingula anatina]